MLYKLEFLLVIFILFICFIGLIPDLFGQEVFSYPDRFNRQTGDSRQNAINRHAACATCHPQAFNRQRKEVCNSCHVDIEADNWQELGTHDNIRIERTKGQFWEFMMFNSKDRNDILNGVTIKGPKEDFVHDLDRQSFKHKDPEQFRKTLDTMRDILRGRTAPKKAPNNRDGRIKAAN